MHAFLKSASAFLLLLPAAGCWQATESGPPNMMPNILGALQIGDARERDAALGTACRDAAEQGSGPAVLMGIPRIEDSPLRDKVAEECAVKLSDMGQSEAAIEVARLISDQSKRDELVARLGGGGE